MPVHASTTTLTQQELNQLIQHREYHGCLNLNGAERAWTERRNDGPFVAYVCDMCQFHSLNHQIGRQATNERVSHWLKLLRHSEIVAGGGDEFCIVVPIGDVIGFYDRLHDALRTAGLYAYVTQIDLDPALTLFEQMEAAITVITNAKSAKNPRWWQLWRVLRLNERATNYRIGETKLI